MANTPVPTKGTSGNITKVSIYHPGVPSRETVRLSMAMHSENPDQDKDVSFYWQSGMDNSRRNNYGYGIVSALLTASELISLDNTAKKNQITSRDQLRLWALDGTLANILDNREVNIVAKIGTKANGDLVTDSSGKPRTDYTPYSLAGQMNPAEFLSLIKTQKASTQESNAADENF